VQYPALNEGIRQFYDKSSPLWEKMWGDHMHHGFYDPDSRLKKSRRQAQIDMIDKVLEYAEVTSVKKMVDVGCGIGGSSRCAPRRPALCSFLQ
jgi:tocopherol O-methyltransferase